MRVVVALGGNAISPPGGVSPIPAQYQATMETAHHLAHLTERPLVVTHGNGPQVGNLLLRSDLAAGVLPRLPLDTCVADTQGGMSFMLQQCLDNAFGQAGVRRATVTVVTARWSTPATRRSAPPPSRSAASTTRPRPAGGWTGTAGR